MINDIVAAIGSAIAKEYPNTPIYREEVPQGQVEPGFYIHLLSPSHRLFFGNRYEKNHTFAIHYFPDETTPRQDLYAMQDELVWALELIAFDERPIRGTGMRGEVVDDILHFLVDYNLFVYRQKEPLPKMETLDITQRSD